MQVFTVEYVDAGENFKLDNHKGDHWYLNDDGKFIIINKVVVDSEHRSHTMLVATYNAERVIRIVTSEVQMQI